MNASPIGHAGIKRNSRQLATIAPVANIITPIGQMLLRRPIPSKRRDKSQVITTA